MPRKTIYKYSVGDIIKTKHGDIEIIEQIRVKYTDGKNVKGYMYKCLKCGNIDKITESQIINKTGCNVCCPTSQKVMIGYNDINTTDQWMIPYFKNVKDVYKYTHKSNQKVVMVCPHCKKEKMRTISKLYFEGLACSCNDKVSYGSKFLTSLAKQLNVAFVTEKVFDWSNSKRYDLCISNKILIENHGVQHYEESPRGLSLKEEQANDEFKKELALKNGIKKEYYIIIDCRKSELEFIKQNILKSNLAQLFNLSKIDWIKCHEFALNNLIKIACEYKKSDPDMTTSDIGKIMGYHQCTIQRWLKKGTGIWCNYNPKEEMRKNASNNRISKFIICIDNGTIFESARDLERKSVKTFGTKLDYRNISAVCNGVQKTHKGCKFKFTSGLTEEEIKEIQEKCKINSNNIK